MVCEVPRCTPHIHTTYLYSTMFESGGWFANFYSKATSQRWPNKRKRLYWTYIQYTSKKTTHTHIPSSHWFDVCIHHLRQPSIVVLLAMSIDNNTILHHLRTSFYLSPFCLSSLSLLICFCSSSLTLFLALSLSFSYSHSLYISLFPLVLHFIYPHCTSVQY